MSQNAFRKMWVVGIEDGSFIKGVTKKTLLAAVLFKGLNIEDVAFERITVDGIDATDKAASMLDFWNFEAVMLAGVSFAGFNVIDPIRLYERFEKPLIIVSRTKPNNKAVKNALMRHFKDWERLWEVFAKLRPIYRVLTVTNARVLYVEVVGAEIKWAARLIKMLTICGRVPEPLRVARIVARGLS